LNHSGFETDAAFDGVEALEFLEKNDYDAIIMDIMMPRMDGIEALQRIRAGGDFTPVLLLTAKSEIDDRVNGLDAGADDYLSKPFAIKELLARVKSMTRRNDSYAPKNLHVGSVTLDIAKQEISSENSISLALKETKLLEFFMLNEGKELSTERIFDHVWKNDEDATTDVVFVYVSFLRSKLHSINADIDISGEKGGSYILKAV
ncbi:MAG: response regulator transcription factor, partial [Clostridia bacterium]|nr:response regulator transcription factor [Clostridia bacterium]